MGGEREEGNRRSLDSLIIALAAAVDIRRHAADEEILNYVYLSEKTNWRNREMRSKKNYGYTESENFFFFLTISVVYSYAIWYNRERILFHTRTTFKKI